MKVCKNCHSPTHANSDYCLACCIEAAGMRVVDWALEMRFHKFSPYSFPAFVKLYAAHPDQFIVTGLNVVDPCILKGCQQIKPEMERLLRDRWNKLPKSPIRKWPQTTQNPRKQHAYEQMAKLLDQLAERQNGRCAYCDVPLTPDNRTLDSVLPLGMNHSKMDPITKEAYYHIASFIGDLRAVCGRCNWIKGQAEMRGLKFMQNLERVGHEVQPALPLQFTRRGPRDLFVPSDYRNHPGVVIPRAELNHAWGQAAAVANQAALRATMPCYHDPNWLLLTWDEETKRLTLGCSKCVDTTKIIWEINAGAVKWRSKYGVRGNRPPRKVERQWVWIPWRELEKHMHLRPQHEITLQTLKRMHERFGFPLPPSLEAVEEQGKARAVETNLEVEVNLDMRRLDGFKDIAEQIEQDHQRQHAALKERLGKRMEDSWCLAE